MSIEAELLEFAKSRPEWQQDVIRRVCMHPDFSGEDLDEVLMNLKASQQLASAGGSAPLTEHHLSQRSAVHHATTALAVIADVKNANQLASGQRLSLALNGITLVFGDNGSGKTGYTRIVKQLCRARRERHELLLGNVYKKTGGPASAKITYLVGAEEHTFDWEDGKSVPSELSRISVFDASTAPLYADRQNEIEFLPLGLDVLPRLGKVCEMIAQRLQTEINALTTAVAVPLPQQIAGTTADAVTQRLSLQTLESDILTVDQIEQAASWSKVDDELLLAIEGELFRLSEPAQTAAQYRRFTTLIRGIVERLTTLEGILGVDAVPKYRNQYDKARAAAEAASIAARGRFDHDPLGTAVANAAWRKLYEYAENFSNEVYPGESFPATGEDRVCLLCQQPYDNAAVDRMRRFRLFIEDTSQKEADKEASELTKYLQTLVSLNVPTTAELELQFMELTDREPSFAPIKAKLNAFIADAGSRRNTLIAALKGEIAFGALGELARAVLNDANEFASPLELRAQEFDKATVSSAATDELKREHTELLGRRQLHASTATVLARRRDILTCQKLRTCEEQCDTSQISRRNTEFREKYLTPDLAKQISKEIDYLGLAYLPIKIDTKTERGTSFIGVALEKVANARSSSILSEGEFRALALACFFAEIAKIPSHDGIVVDDPVSSLDHRHIRQVAWRLVDEAKVRPQVIVFTHDLSFYYELLAAASEARIPVQRNWVQHSRVLGFGVVAADDGPWQVKKTKERINELEKSLADIPLEGSVPINEYQKYVSHFYTRLRETWERLIEERLFNGVVGRFQPGVMSLSLKGVTVTDEDYQKIFFAMKKASEFSGHDWAPGREGDLPDKASMAQELLALREYEKDLSQRTAQLEKHRRELEQPPKAKTI